MLLAEDLALLLHDDDTGKGAVDQHTTGLALAGAVLLELAMRGHVRVAAEGEDVREGRLVVDDAAATGDAVLDDGLAIVRGKEGKKPKSTLEGLRKGLRERVLERLVDAGELRREEGRTLGVFRTTRWPAADGRREAEIRAAIDSAVLRGAEPDDRTAALVALLVAVDAVKRTIPSDDPKAAKARAKEIAEGPWAADAVRQAVQDVQTAVMTAVITATTAATISGS